MRNRTRCGNDYRGERGGLVNETFERVEKTEGGQVRITKGGKEQECGLDARGVIWISKSQRAHVKGETEKQRNGKEVWYGFVGWIKLERGVQETWCKQWWNQMRAVKKRNG